MAAVMGIGRVQAFLQDAVRQGCSMVWIEHGALMAGADLAEPHFAIDFLRERMMEVKRSRDAAMREPPLPPTRKSYTDRAKPLELIEPSILASAARQTGNYSLILEGKIITTTSLKSLLLSGFETIERLRPGTMDKLAGEKGRTKRVVARQRDLLYGRSSLTKHAKQIEGGWWVATNNSGDEVEKYIRRAAFHAGLDVEVRR